MTTTKKKVLVVDDDAALRGVLEKKIKMDGYHVETAEDGMEGITKALNVKPDLILLDLLMPKMDGMTVLTRLREDAWGKNAKVVLLTNLDDSAKVAEALAHGTFDYLVKSDWNIEDVTKKIKEKIGNP